MEELITYLQYGFGGIASLAGIYKGVKILNKIIWIPVKTHFERIDQACRTLEAQKDLSVVIQKKIETLEKKIAYELTTNGGGSLKDQCISLGLSVLRLEGLLLASLNTSDCGIFLTDSSGKFIWVTGWFSEQLGWLPSEMMGSGWKNILAISDKEKVFVEWTECVSEKRDFHMKYKFIVKSTEDNIEVTTNAFPMKHATNGSIFGYVGFVKRN